jgi:HSP20 family protein
MEEATSLRPSIDRLFVRFFNGWKTFFPDDPRPGRWSPVVESRVEGESLIFRVALPGVDPKDVGVLVLGNRLILKGVRGGAPTRGDGTSAPGAPGDGWFEHTSPLPDGVSADSVTARYHDGVLEVTMPAPKRVTAKRIPIEVRSGPFTR